MVLIKLEFAHTWIMYVNDRNSTFWVDCFYGRHRLSVMQIRSDSNCEKLSDWIRTIRLIWGQYPVWSVVLWISRPFSRIENPSSLIVKYCLFMISSVFTPNHVTSLSPFHSTPSLKKKKKKGLSRLNNSKKKMKNKQNLEKRKHRKRKFQIIKIKPNKHLWDAVMHLRILINN